MPNARCLIAVVLALGAATSWAQVDDQPNLRMPVPTSAQAEAQKHLKEGQVLMSEDAFMEASRQFEAAIAQDPGLFMAYYGLGTARMATKEFAAAAAAFEAARRAFEARAERNGHLLLRAQQARETRIRTLRDAMQSPANRRSGTDTRPLEAELRALELAAGDAEPSRLPPGLLLALGSAYFRTGRLADAEREYRAAVDAEPKLGEARSNLAVILLMRGRAPEAQEQVKLAKKHGFKPPAGLVADIDKAVAAGPKTSN
ncbi:MAG: tetratricopeptide repeat protein [Vicinamibacteria bacterium]